MTPAFIHIRVQGVDIVWMRAQWLVLLSSLDPASQLARTITRSL